MTIHEIHDKTNGAETHQYELTWPTIHEIHDETNGLATPQYELTWLKTEQYRKFICHISETTHNTSILQSNSRLPERKMHTSWPVPPIIII